MDLTRSKVTHDAIEAEIYIDKIEKPTKF